MNSSLSEKEWNNINALAELVDQKLENSDVRLTIGGEPTFVSKKNRESPEWKTHALGDEKQEKGIALLQRLRKHFSSAGVLQYSHGKWCPDEPTPRWAYHCIWRTDGETLWKDDKLLANPKKQGKASEEDLTQFVEVLSKTLNLNNDCLLEAYEDPVYHCWEEHNIPPDLNKDHFDLKQEHQRKTLLEKLKSDLDKKAGYILPLHWDIKENRWASDKWTLKDEYIYLLPGSLPLGDRLPLHRLSSQLLEKPHYKSPFAEEGPLPSYDEVLEKLNTDSKKESLVNHNTHSKQTLTLALVNGVPHVYLPPTTHAEHTLELIAAIEISAKALSMPVIIEGYSPPRDKRLLSFSITPDPGVLEVNIHPSSNWQDLSKKIQTLFDEADALDLGTEKFLIDGRKVSTGGGNHITLGGQTPNDSPFLRRPDLLQSFITFWQHHPALSYLFSGLFIGPTCQSPRVDETRYETLYELEIAFNQIKQGETSSYWVIDRLLRHLLVDITGNTHRSEFCIDKLYSPDSELGRQGLVELRGFEMCASPQLYLLQNLLIRALVSCFWNKPYEKKLIPWGAELHGRFMLPHFIWEDFKDVIAFLKKEGYDFESKWFHAFYESRFPSYGKVKIKNIEIGLNMALEPWNVLGEEVNSGSTSRRVDSAIERLEVSVKNFDKEKHILLCNNIPVPLHTTSNLQSYIAGIRFKAWPASLTLHPNLPVHAPLVFHLVEKATQTIIGGCIYHTLKPDGEMYNTLPKNEKEARRRCHARFESKGYAAGHIEIPAIQISTEYPHTLDLRKFQPIPSQRNDPL